MSKLSFARTGIFWALTAACAAAAASSAHARKPRNPRWHKKISSPARVPRLEAESLEKSSAPRSAQEPGQGAARLSPGRWRPEVKKAVEDLVAGRGKDSSKYDAQNPPAAVVAFNDAAIVNDIGEAVFQRMVDRADFKFHDGFWREVPIAYGRQRLRAAQEIFAQTPVSTWPQQPAYHQYRKGFFQAYQDMCSKLGRLECRTWLAKLLRGYRAEEVSSYAMATMGEAFMRPVQEELVRSSPEDTAPIAIRRGLAFIPEIKELVSLLLKSGFDVWVIDANEQKQLEVVTREYGIDISRNWGIRGKLVQDKLSGEVSEPVPINGGKAVIAVTQLGRPPALVVGSSRDDQEMLFYGGGVKLLLDRGDPALRRLAEEKGWLVQPAFLPRAPVPEPAKP